MSAKPARKHPQNPQQQPKDSNSEFILRDEEIILEGPAGEIGPWGPYLTEMLADLLDGYISASVSKPKWDLTPVVKIKREWWECYLEDD